MAKKSGLIVNCFKIEISTFHRNSSPLTSVSVEMVETSESINVLGVEFDSKSQ
jgi:hypothetical protein